MNDETSLGFWRKCWIAALTYCLFVGIIGGSGVVVFGLAWLALNFGTPLTVVLGVILIFCVPLTIACMRDTDWGRK